MDNQHFVRSEYKRRAEARRRVVDSFNGAIENEKSGKHLQYEDSEQLQELVSQMNDTVGPDRQVIATWGRRGWRFTVRRSR